MAKKKARTVISLDFILNNGKLLLKSKTENGIWEVHYYEYNNKSYEVYIKNGKYDHMIEKDKYI